MLTRRYELADRLFELEPAKTYPKRAAEHIAEVLGVQGFRLQIGDDMLDGGASSTGSPALSLPLEAGDERIGTLHLYGDVGSDEEQQVARWAAGLLARGVRYARRLDGGNGKRTYEDVQAMLERTPLTPRERDVVGRLLSGASTRQIAESTGLTVATVNTYLKRIFAKLGVHSRVELVARVTGTRGVIPSEPAPAKREAEGDNPQP